jgi:hypothetical protein
MTARDADALGRQVATAVADRLPEAGSLTWAARAAPATTRDAGKPPRPHPSVQARRPCLSTKATSQQTLVNAAARPMTASTPAASG